MVQNNKITQENDSQSVAVVSYLQVVDDGDGVQPPVDWHGADPGPGSVRRIELQDVVSVGVAATCIVLLYIITQIVLVTSQIMSEWSPGYHCLYLLSPLYCPVWRPSETTGVRGEQQSRSRRWRRGADVQCCLDGQSSIHRSPTEPAD